MPPKKRLRKSSKPTPEQQTITQMDPFKEQLYLAGNNEGLEEEYVPVAETPRRRKRRKTTSLTPIASTVQTRNSRKKVAKADVKRVAMETLELHDQNISGVDQGTNTSLPESQDIRIPPPQTPKRIRKRVVPSSQSPAETPLSIHSKRNTRDKNITPLGERSVNTPSRNRLSSRKKTVQWAPKLEVADSTSMEDEDSELLFPPIACNRLSGNTAKKPSSPQLQISCEPSKKATKSPQTNRQGSDSKSMKRKATIADSEDEDSTLLNRSPEKENKGQSQGFDSTNSSTSKTDVSGPRTASDHQPMSKPSRDSSQEDLKRETSFGIVPTQLIHQPPESLHSALEHITKQSQYQSQKHSSDSEEVSAQLKNGLLRSSSPAPLHQPPALETESQFENAWREFTPPQLDLEDDQTLEPAAEELTLPTLPNPNQNHSSTDLPPIPPSQATTTDITQPTPHQSRVDSDPQLLVSSPAQHPPPFSSSSPFHTRKDPAPTTFMGYQGWNGIRMTDSQLLPHSLLNDSLELPPMFREEELELEEE
ncbi:MAG: hypothetical protein Q9225_007992 [Loekoesia sp. 1 TL-2023]